MHDVENIIFPNNYLQEHSKKVFTVQDSSDLFHDLARNLPNDNEVFSSL